MGQVRAKFEGPYPSPERTDALVNALLTLDEASDIGELLRLTRPDRAAPLKAAAGDD